MADGGRAQFRAVERRGHDRLEEVGVLEVIGVLARGDLRVVPVHRAGELLGGQAQGGGERRDGVRLTHLAGRDHLLDHVLVPVRALLLGRAGDLLLVPGHAGGGGRGERGRVEHRVGRVALFPQQPVGDAVGRGLVEEPPSLAVDDDDPARQVRLIDAGEVRVQQPQAAVATGDLRADLAGEIERVPAGAVRPDVPGPAGPGGRRVELGQLGRVVAETPGGQHDRAGRDRVVPHGHTDHRAAGDQEPVDPLPQGNLDAAVHELVVVLDAEVTEPLHGRAGQVGQPPGQSSLDVPVVERHVVVEQRVRVIGDAQGPLVARARAHGQAAGQPRRPADQALRLGDQDAGGSVLAGGKRGGQARCTRPEHEHVDVPIVCHRAASTSGARVRGTSAQRCGVSRAGSKLVSMITASTPAALDWATSSQSSSTLSGRRFAT